MYTSNEIICKIYKYLTYNELVGRAYDRSMFIDSIKKIPVEELVTVIYQLSCFSDETIDNYVKQYFVKFIGTKMPLNEQKIKLINQSKLITKQGLLALIKWFIAYGDFDKRKQIDVEYGINKILLMSIIVADYMIPKGINSLNLKGKLNRVEKKNILHEVACNMMLNKSENYGAELARIYNICYKISSNRGLFGEEFVDFNNDFQAFYGYSIMEYLSFVLIFSSFSTRINEKINMSINYTMEMFFEQMSLDNDKISKIIRTLSMDMKVARKWALGNIDYPYDFSLFYEKPLIPLDGGKSFVPISNDLFLKNIFIKIKIQISKIYKTKSEKTRFNTFWGRPFEIYVQSLAMNMNNKKYTIIEEFSYIGKKSPDVIICYEDKVLVIEAKAKSLRKEGIFNDSIDEFNRDKDRLVIEPIKQSFLRIMEIIEGDFCGELKEIKDIYLMSVTMGDFPFIKTIEEDIRTEINNCTKNSIKGYFHFSIAEYEILCGIMERDKHNVFEVLSEYFNEMSINNCFNDFLYNKHYGADKPQIIHSDFREFSEFARSICANR